MGGKQVLASVVAAAISGIGAYSIWVYGPATVNTAATVLGGMVLALITVLDHRVQTKSSETHLEVISRAVARGSIVQARWYRRGQLKELTMHPAQADRPPPPPVKSEVEAVARPPFGSRRKPPSSGQRTA
jgi:hypothetical protein